MSETPPETAEPAPKKSKLPLIIGLVLMLGLGGGGFYAVYSGLILGTHEAAPEEAQPVAALPEVGYVPIEPMVVSLGPQPGGRYLQFTAQLEVQKGHEEETLHIMPRVMDVLNGYLRAVQTKDLEDPMALVRLRAQMLRRVQMVTGEGRVRDLLITEFVIN